MYANHASPLIIGWNNKGNNKMKNNIAENADLASELLDIKDSLSAMEAVKQPMIDFGTFAVIAVFVVAAIAVKDADLAAEVWLYIGNLLVVAVALYAVILASWWAAKALMMWGIHRLGFSEAGLERMALHY